jgi:hypothetical protein
VDARFTPAAEPPPLRGEAGGEVRGYSPWPTLRPHYWELRYRDPVEAPAVVRGGVPLPRAELLPWGLGIESCGYDLVGRHAWAA